MKERQRESISGHGGGGHGPVSSESGAQAAAAEGGRDLVELGHMVETHGGGSLESVPGFDLARAMTEGFEGGYSQLDREYEELQLSCRLEYERGESGYAESICGRDDRARIGRTTSVPWRSICQLVVTRKDGLRSKCTGWFIGPRTVATAGHCVFSHEAGGWSREIEVIPGIDSAAHPFGSAVGTSFRSVSGWTVDRDPQYDYGAIVLPDDVLGQRTGWFGFAALSDSSLQNLLVNNAGYSGDKPFGTLWFNAGRIIRIEERRLHYMVDTYGGNSGSPVWRYSNGQRIAIGVHAYGGCPNKSTRITEPVFENLKRWKESTD